MQSSPVDLAITFGTNSPFLSNPTSLANSHPVLHDLQYTKPAGELGDVLVFTVPATNFEGQRDEMLRALKSVESVLRVDVLELRRRAKRDEF